MDSQVNTSWKLVSTLYLRLHLAMHLCWLANDLHSLWSRSNLHTSQCKFFTVWPPNPLVNVSYVTSINLSLDSEKQDMSALKWFSHDLCILARKLVSPFGHPTQVQLAATRGYQWQPVTTGESVWPGLRDVRVKILQLCFLFETFATLRW